jgi:hypothetical protein
MISPPCFHCHLQHLFIVEYYYTTVAVDLDTIILALTPPSPEIYPHAISFAFDQK